jgi:hypothetical protein
MTYQPGTPTPRTGLQKTRDIALTVMAVLVSVVCGVILYVTIAAGSALSELGKADPTPTFNFDEPVPTNSAGEECIGEVPPEGC